MGPGAARQGGGIFYGRALTYRELDDLSDRFAALLAAHGVAEGDRVAVFLPNCPQFLVAFHGILKRGPVHVPVNPLFREPELAYELEDTSLMASDDADRRERKASVTKLRSAVLRLEAMIADSCG